ncbi:MAG: hypothetical protein ACUZ8E_12090 [Candidatus Anammoxibacter sp.]
MSEEPTKKGIMIAYAKDLKFTDLEKNDKVKKFLEGLDAADKDPNSPGFKIVDFGIHDSLSANQVQITGGEDVRDEVGKALTFVGDGGPARYIFAL